MSAELSRAAALAHRDDLLRQAAAWREARAARRTAPWWRPAAPARRLRAAAPPAVCTP